MKKITLHTAALDNAGARCEAGTVLTVGDSDEPGNITAKRAKELLGAHLAATESAETEELAAPAKATKAG